MGAFPDPRSLGPEELKLYIKELVSREPEISATRKELHTQIDALRRELVESLRAAGDDIIAAPTSWARGRPASASRAGLVRD